MSTQVGTITIENNRATLNFSRFINASPTQVWEAIVNPNKFGTWYNATAEIEPKEGGMFTVHSGPFTWKGKVVNWEPEHLFKYEHNHEAVTEMPTGAETIVTWTLQPKDDGTELTFTQSGLPSTAGFAPGTHVVIDRLVAFIEGKDMPDFEGFYNEVEPLYTVWNMEA